MERHWRVQSQDQVSVGLLYSSLRFRINSRRISANRMAIQEYQALVDDDLEYLQSHPKADRKMLKVQEHHLELSTKPTTTYWNCATTNEMEALIALGAKGCPHAPCLIGVAADS